MRGTDASSKQRAGLEATQLSRATALLGPRQHECHHRRRSLSWPARHTVSIANSPNLLSFGSSCQVRGCAMVLPADPTMPPRFHGTTFGGYLRNGRTAAAAKAQATSGAASKARLGRCREGAPATLPRRRACDAAANARRLLALPRKCATSCRALGFIHEGRTCAQIPTHAYKRKHMAM